MSDRSASRASNSYPAISDDLLSFKTNRQLYLETMPLWFQHNEVNITDRSLSFRNTVRLFKAISAERLSHVRVVNVKHQPITPDSSMLRVWRDRTGTFQLDAAYRDLNHHKIFLTTLDGYEVAVPVAKMSIVDLEYVERITGVELIHETPRIVRGDLLNRRYEDWHNPLPLLMIEEEMLPQDIRVNFVIHRNQRSAIWKYVYDVAKRCRKSGMNWEDIGECVNDMQAMLWMAGWAAKTPDDVEERHAARMRFHERLSEVPSHVAGS